MKEAKAEAKAKAKQNKQLNTQSTFATGYKTGLFNSCIMPGYLSFYRNLKL